ncbi:RNA recognition domain-containing protein [Seiridium cupressi]
MGKRKSEDDNPTTMAANGDLSGSKKRQRLSEGEPDAKRSKKEKKDKKDKKDKKFRKRPEPEVEEDIVDMAMTEYEDSKQGEAKEDDATGAATPANTGAEAAGDKPKKKRKKSKKAAKDGDEEKPAAVTEEKADQGSNEEATGKPKKNRFIVFVGNLPYTATTADIEKHFSAVQPIAVRLLHEKANPNKSRGIAFLEFAGFDHMKTCLKTMHHSTLTCQGRDHRGRPKTEERTINVELTAGGGGNTEGRKEKIKAKNEKLDGERERRAVEEEKQRIKKEQERLAKEGQKKSGADGIHPSRRGRVPGHR